MKVKTAFFVNKAGGFLRDPENGLSIVIALVMVLYMIKCISMVLTSAFSFDGAVFAQISQNLAKNLRYATNYQGKLFDPIITTGIPVTLPVAIFFLFFGDSFASGLTVNAIYLISLAFAIIYYLKKCLGMNYFFVLLATILLYGTPRLFDLGFGLYGEIPMLFFFILAAIFLNKYEDTSRAKYLFGAGIFLGLSYLTKPFILICVPALIFTAIFDLVVKRKVALKVPARVRYFFQEYPLLPLGFFVLVLVFELYKLISIGVVAYFRSWEDLWNSVMVRSGFIGGESITNGISGKFITHLGILSTTVCVRKEIIVFLLVMLLLSFFAILSYGIYLLGKKQHPGKSEEIFFSNDVLVLIAGTLSYFGWWLFIVPTPAAYYRYIFVGYILLEICLVILAVLLVKYAQKLEQKTRKIPYLLYRFFTIGYISLLLAGSVYDMVHSKNYTLTFKDSAEKAALLEAGQYIRNLPESAEILGYGWWQAPVIAFASGRTFNNIFNDIEMRKAGPLNEKYLVVDSYASRLGSGTYHNILAKYDNQLVFSQAANSIYKLNSRPLFAYEAFNDLEKGKVSYSWIDFSGNHFDAFVRNVYTDEKNIYGKWAQDVSGYLFKYNHEGTLKIYLWFDDPEKYDQKPIELRIYANRIFTYRYVVTQDGSQEIIVPLQNINGDTLEITIICNSDIILDGNQVQPAIFLNGMILVK